LKSDGLTDYCITIITEYDFIRFPTVTHFLMDEKTKKALIKKISTKAAFNSRYSEENRQWFAGKIIDSLLASGTPDAQAETKATDAIKKATTAVAAREKKGFGSGTLKAQWADYNELTSRVQIIYGTLAMNPLFLDGAHDAFLDFIIERRYRTVKRMVYFVNPNKKRQIFSYPFDGCVDFKVNKDSQLFWESLHPAGGNRMPFGLNSGGQGSPMVAVDSIFKKNKDCDKNIFPCDPVTTILHMDALQAAKDKDKFLKKLIAEGKHYLKIDHPFGHFGNFEGGAHLLGLIMANVSAGNSVEIPVSRVTAFMTDLLQKSFTFLTQDMFHNVSFFCRINHANLTEVIEIQGVNPVQKKIKVKKLTNSYPAGAKIYSNNPQFAGIPPFHFLTDSRPDKANFEQVAVNMDELQVGDHLFVSNHPLYQRYYPDGLWGGEQSFVIEIGGRRTAETAFDTGLKVAGHGLSNTIIKMGEDLLSWINTVLGVIQEMTRIHLKHIKDHGTSSAAGVSVSTKLVNGVNHHVFEYDKPYTYKDWQFQIDTTAVNGFVILQEGVVESEFIIHNFFDKSFADPRKARQLVSFLPSSLTAATRFKVENWGLRFLNKNKSQTEDLPLFKLASNNKQVPNFLTFADLKKTSPFLRLDENKDAFVTRPRVDFDATYQKFLKDNGAI
jgi:hypothetical protein